jgi:CHAT domain-containing protein
MVSQPNAKNLPPIPGVKKEITLIRNILEEHGVRNSTIESAAATKEATVKHMKDFSCIHLACHASQNALRSSFHLHDGPLELGAIIQSNMNSADLAFLSACQTSVGDERLPEEVVHLAAGMMAAGYRSVVATMWSIGDKSAPEVAESFYRHMLVSEGSNGGIGGDRAAVALYEAVKELRMKSDLSEDSLLKWVPYVHFGI